ncbi:MAG: hypothetical protein IT427_00595 [Pirellulales bacterium]|nr:hypothetical protein [Pirellulales bacterium]
MSRVVLIAGLLFSTWNVAEAAISHGRQVLLNRGLQLQAWVFSEDTIVPGFRNVDQFLGANFSTVNFYQSADPQFPAMFQTQADVPWQWARLSSSWAPDLLPGELPYLDKFASMQFGDELPQNQATLDAEKAAYARWNQMYPNTLAHTNFYGGQMSASALTNYMQYTRPDMLMFDNYPGFSFTTSARNTWYSNMQLYRTTALAGYDGTGSEPLPYAQYLDLYRTTGGGGVPSESFVRLQQSASWAFGYTFTSAFVYNKPNDPGVFPVMFSGTGDGSPTPVFGYVAESNRQSRNLGQALVRLVSTDIRMIPGSGRSVSGTGLSAWGSNANGGNNFIAAITPTQSQGGSNDSSYNDILVGYYKPLLANNSDFAFADGSHFMLVNGASQGTAAASAQWYHLTFDFRNSGYNALERLSRDTGLVERIDLTHMGGSIYSLDLNLPGGSGDLFRYASAIPTLPPKDSSQFTYRYEMNVSPATQDLDGNQAQDLYLDETAGTIQFSNGFATLVNTNQIHSPYEASVWQSSGISLASGYTIEVRAKILSDSGSFPIFGITANPDSTANSFLLATEDNQSWSAGANAIDLGSANNSDGFHIYRVAQEPGGAVFRVWRDGVPLNGQLNSAFLNSLFRLNIGGLSADSVGSTEIDYLRFTAGAFAPSSLVPGDFDSDGDVDGADFVAWQTHFPLASGTTLAMGDADSDGDVDGADFVLWQTHFPTSNGSGARTIPEPATWLLCCLSTAAMALVLSRRIG